MFVFNCYRDIVRGEEVVQQANQAIDIWSYNSCIQFDKDDYSTGVVISFSNDQSLFLLFIFDYLKC